MSMYKAHTRLHNFTKKEMETSKTPWSSSTSRVYRQVMYVEKLKGDPWTLVTSDQPVRLAISKWSQDDHKTQWIGEGFTKFAVLVCDMLKLEFGTHC